MSDRAPRQLYMLADVLDATAQNHVNVAALFAEHSADISRQVLRLADELRETAEQIRRGRYGDPGSRG